MCEWLLALKLKFVMISRFACLFVCLIAMSIHSNNEDFMTLTRHLLLRDCCEVSLSFNEATFNVIEMRWKELVDFFFLFLFNFFSSQSLNFINKTLQQLLNKLSNFVQSHINLTSIFILTFSSLMNFLRVLLILVDVCNV